MEFGSNVSDLVEWSTVKLLLIYNIYLLENKYERYTHIIVYIPSIDTNIIVRSIYIFTIYLKTNMK